MLISRLELISILYQQFSGRDIPLMIDKTRSETYDVDKTKLGIVCCQIGHKHFLTPRQILNLFKIKNGPCPICAKIYVNDNSVRRTTTNEEMSDIGDRFKNDAEIASEITRISQGIEGRESYRPARTIQENEVITEFEYVGEGVARSMDYDEYIKYAKSGRLDPKLLDKNILPGEKVVNNEVDDSNVEVAESIDYDEFVKNNPNVPLNDKQIKNDNNMDYGFIEDTGFGNKSGSLEDFNKDENVENINDDSDVEVAESIDYDEFVKNNPENDNVKNNFDNILYNENSKDPWSDYYDCNDEE